MPSMSAARPLVSNGASSSRSTLSRWEASHGEINVGELERWASLVGGGALALYGLSRMDLPGILMGIAGGALVCRGATGHCEMYHALGLNTSEQHGAATSIPAGHGFKVERSITINRQVGDVYRFWSRLENLPHFMRHLQSVTTTGGNRSHWIAKGPLGIPAEWDAEIINRRDNELIAWRSLPGSIVDTAGSVHFRQAPGGRGTQVLVALKYNPPAGKAGSYLAELLGESPEQQIEEDLRHFKQLLESGETATAR